MLQARSLVGGDNADAAINCVSIAPEFDIVRQFVFNGVLVAKENKMAHDLCFNHEIRTITFQTNFIPQSTQTN